MVAIGFRGAALTNPPRTSLSALKQGYRTIFTKDFPARATVGTGLVNADGLVEIMFVASK